MYRRSSASASSLRCLKPGEASCSKRDGAPDVTDHVSVSVGAAPETDGQSYYEETEQAASTGCICEPVGSSDTCGGKNSSPVVLPTRLGPGSGTPAVGSGRPLVPVTVLWP